MSNVRLDRDTPAVEICSSCASQVAAPGQRPRVIEFCRECAVPPDDELEAHYWAIGGSD
jgi:hypothetical protein